MVKGNGGGTMKEFTVGANDAGQRLDRFVAKLVPLLPASLEQKYLRLKRIKVNGRGAARDYRLRAGDTIQLYINDEFFETPSAQNAYLTVSAPKLDIVYEDGNILLCDKRPGLAVHPHDGAEYGKTLIDHIQAYLYARGEWKPRQENAFAPALCNRIDRNTEGLVIAAKTAAALRDMNAAIRDRKVHKHYLTITAAPLPKNHGICKAWLKKGDRQVTVSDKPADSTWKQIVTEYRVLAQHGQRQLVQITLHTGRTHQIRAHLAFLGAPVLGDPKYGSIPSNEENQCLCAWSLSFAELKGTAIEALDGQTVSVPVPDFVRRYFPDVRLAFLSLEASR